MDFGNFWRGLVVFTAIKSFAYTIIALFLNRYFLTKANVFLVGTSRSILGVILGMSSYYFLTLFPIKIEFVDFILPLYLLWLFLLKMFGWHLILNLYYSHSYQERTKSSKLIMLILCSGLSYLIDIPAVIGLLFTADTSVC